MMRNVKSLYLRNLISVMAILLVSQIMLAIVFSVFCYNYMIKDKRDSLESTAGEVSRMVSAYSMSWELNGLNMRMALSSFSDTSGFDIMLCDSSGRCVSCSDKIVNCQHIGRYVGKTVIGAIDTSSEGMVSSKGDLGGVLEKKSYFVGQPVKDFLYGNTIGYVFLVVNSRVLNNMWQEFIFLYIMVSAFVVMFAFAVTRIVTKKQTEPIDEIAKAANKFAHGDFSARITETNRKDEIGELEDAFNVMAENLETSEMRRRDFIANVSHELKTPMTTITGFADGLLDGTIPKEEENKYLEMISSEAKRLSRLVRGMLDASRVQEVDRADILSKSFNIVETASIALLSLEKKINDKGLDVEVNMPEEPLMVRGDSDTITQVIYNLLDNAAKFARAGSSLGIEVWQEKGKVYVSVENEGNTIPADEITSIFERFHKTDKSRSQDKDGVGLGLYIVKTILDRHGEDIFVKSADDRTKFTFTLTPLPVPKKNVLERGQGGKKDGQNGKKEKQTDEKSQAADKKGRD